MAAWSKTFTNIDRVNNGNEYTLNDYGTTDTFNVPMNNTQFLHDHCVGNYSQSFTETEKNTARSNIDAARGVASSGDYSASVDNDGTYAGFSVGSNSDQNEFDMKVKYNEVSFEDRNGVLASFSKNDIINLKAKLTYHSLTYTSSNHALIYALISRGVNLVYRYDETIGANMHIIYCNVLANVRRIGGTSMSINLQYFDGTSFASVPVGATLVYYDYN